MNAKATEVSNDVRQVAKRVAGEARSTMEAGVETGKDTAARRLASVADALRKTSERLEQEDDVMELNEYFSSAADRIESASNYLRSRSMHEMVGDVEKFARREPALFLGGAFVVGLLGGRFLKSSRNTLVSHSTEHDGRTGRDEALAHDARPKRAESAASSDSKRTRKHSDTVATGGNGGHERQEGSRRKHAGDR